MVNQLSFWESTEASVGKQGPKVKGETSVSVRNTLNELTGAQWLYFTQSILITTYPSEYRHDLRKQHGANKPPQLMCQLIEFFTKPGQRVLAPFAGVGGTLIGASICEKPRQAVGIEINPRWVEIYQQIVEESQGTLAGQEILQGDCLSRMQELEAESFDCIATDPPYTIHLEQTMSSRSATRPNRRSNYDMRSDDPADLANLESHENFLGGMERVFTECFRLLKPQKYLVLIIGNSYQHGEYLFTHVDLARRAQQRGFIPKGEIIWYQVGARLRPYGYPVAYIPNIAHQYILVLQKPKGGRRR